MISTIEKPDKGSIQIEGNAINYKDLKEIDTIRSKVIGILFQSKNLLPEFTVLENLMLPSKLNNIVNHHDPKILLDEFDLYDKASYYPAQLSAGESQRISLLRSVVNKPKLIIADEPTANLDEKNLYKMITFIKKIKLNYNSSFIIATHDERLCDLADRILYLNNGKLLKRNNK
jgi:ABC-type lipoprotein export system ATPase subunit